MQSTLRANKKALRKAIQATLNDLPTKTIQDQSQAIAHQIVRATWFTRCRSVSCYLSMPSGEVDTGLLVSEILRAGKSLYVPRIDRSVPNHMDLLRVHDENDLQSLASGTWGIKEPSEQYNGAARSNVNLVLNDGCDALDLILVPGVAFDHSLSRLGHGKGYYDRFITSYAAKRSRPLLVALALRQQIIDGEVPIDTHDWKMDMIVGPDGIIGGTDVE